MIESKIITPGVCGIYTSTEQAAKVAAITMKTMLNLIAQTHHVYLRREVTTESLKDFESSDVKYLTTCRFYITEGLPGIFNHCNIESGI